MNKSSNSVRIGIAVAIILGTIGWLAFTGYGSNKSYYVTIAELGGMGERLTRAISVWKVSFSPAPSSRADRTSRLC